MIIKRKFDELIDTLYPTMKPVDDVYLITMGVYIVLGALFYFCSLAYFYFAKENSTFSETKIYLYFSSILVLCFAISATLIKKNKRNLMIRLSPWIFETINYVMLIFYVSHLIIGINPLIPFFSCLAYFLLNAIFQVIIIDIFSERNQSLMMNLMYLPFGILASIIILGSIYGTIMNHSGNLILYLGLGLFTIFYQLIIFEFVFATRGEKVYQEQLNQSRYGDSVSALLKNKGK